MNMTKAFKTFAALAASVLLGGTAFAATPMVNWYGGPVYHGAPALAVTSALVKAGGGARHFTFSRALVSMLGKKTVNAEVAKLDHQYGKKAVSEFIHGMTWDVHDGLKRATEAGVKLPAAPTDLKGVKLAKTLVGAGTADETFYAGHLFDHALSHKIHVQVMYDVNAKFGPANDLNTHKILNQAMYDVAHALGDRNVKLASLH